jgi:mono/diheme cytochrome c family protein
MMKNEIWWWSLIPLLFVALFLLNLYVFSGEHKGKALYIRHCASCHGDQGEGLRQLIPPLNASDFVQKHPGRIACIIRYGMQGEVVVNGKTFNQPMPANPQLSEVEIANIVNYVLTAWDNDLPDRSPAQIKKDLQQCKE